MVGSLRAVWLGALGACLIIGTALAQDAAPDNTAADEAAAQAEYAAAMQLYMALDFSEALAQCECVEIKDVNATGSFSLSDLEVDELTEAERGFLAEYQVPGLGWVSIGKIIQQVYRQIVDSNGVVPANGAEVMLANDGQLTTLDNAQYFISLEPVEQLKEAWRGLNPATGRFIDGFNNPDWHQFGVYIGKVTGKDAIRYLPTQDMERDKPGFHDKPLMNSYQAWEVIVFGEAPGRILVQNTRLQELEPSEEYPAKPVTYMYSERPGKPASVPETPQVLLDHDFTDVMKQFHVYPYNGDEVPEQPLKRLYYIESNYFNEHLTPSHPLTQKEREFLGQRVLAEKNCHSLFLLLGSLKMLDTKYGRPPAGVIELHSELATPEGLAEFTSLTPEDQFVQYGDAVNPITGKFYTTFSDPNWSPGGIYIEVVEDSNEVVARYKELYDAGELQDRNPPWDDAALAGMRIYITTVFGEEPGTVLFKRYEWGN